MAENHCGIILALACVVFIYGINKPFLSPFTKEVKYDKPLAVGYSDNNKTIIDKQGQRMLILNSCDELISLVDTGKSGSPVDVITGSCIDGDTIYVTGYSRIEKGIVIGSEKLIAYNMKGKVKEVLYTREYKDTDKITTPYFNTLTINNHKVYITSIKDKSVSVYRVDTKTKKTEEMCRTKSPETVYSGIYIADLEEVFIMCRSTNCYYVKQDKQDFEPIAYKQIIKKIVASVDNPELTEKASEMQTIFCFPAVASDFEGKELHYIFVDRSNGDFSIFSNAGDIYNSPNRAPYSSGFFVKNLLHWISAGLLMILLILLIVWLIVKKGTKKQEQCC